RASQVDSSPDKEKELALISDTRRGLRQDSRSSRAHTHPCRIYCQCHNAMRQLYCNTLIFIRIRFDSILSRSTRFKSAGITLSNEQGLFPQNVSTHTKHKIYLNCRGGFLDLANFVTTIAL